MAEPKSSSLVRSIWSWLVSLLLILSPIFLAVVLYQPAGFDPAPLPSDYDSWSASVAVPAHCARARAVSERVGDGVLLGPEDLAYDAEAGVLYTGCYDGWIKRVKLSDDDLTVENWTYVGGRPLGLALGQDKSLVVADAHKGLLLVKGPDRVELLTEEAEGVKFRLTDGVDVASDGTIYFTDASYKYNLDVHMLDLLEGRPHGRLMSFHPTTNQTVVLVRDLYFANGVSLAPDENSLIFCESLLRRCKRYHVRGEKKGKIEKFIENLPGFPDNIRYDGEGSYWIALSVGRRLSWNIVLKYPFLRKMMAVLGKFLTLSKFLGDGGILSVSLEGQPLALYSDQGLHGVTGGLKIDKYLYYGSLHEAYVSRIDIIEHAAAAK